MKTGEEARVSYSDTNCKLLEVVGYLKEDFNFSSEKLVLEWVDGGVLYMVSIPSKMVIKLEYHCKHPCGFTINVEYPMYDKKE